MNETNGNVPTVFEGDLVNQEIDVISLAEKSIDRWKKVAGLAISLTTPKDWVNQDGSPYLQHSGAERIARQFRISIVNVKKEKIWSEDEKGERSYIWVYEGYATMPEVGTQHAVGNCSSKDTLFGKIGKEYKVLSQIDEPSIMKAAHTNLIVNAITHMLGLRNLEWDDLKKYEITVENCTKIEHKSGTRGGSQERNLPDGVKKKRDDIRAMVREMFNGDEAAIEIYYVKQTTWKKNDGETVEGYTLSRWSEKQITYAYDRISKEYSQTMGFQFGHGPDSNGGE